MEIPAFNISRRGKPVSRRSQDIRSHWKRLGISALPAFAWALMPKCPFCWAAILGTVGLRSVISATWMQPLALLLLALAPCSIALRARRTHSFAPLILGTSAAIAIYACKVIEDFAAGVYLSGAVLIAASLWIPRSGQTPDKKAGQAAACPCSTLKTADRF